MAVAMAMAMAASNDAPNKPPLLLPFLCFAFTQSFLCDCVPSLSLSLCGLTH